MDNITALRSNADVARAGRAAFVHQQLKNERWSIRQAALTLGMNHTVLGSRLNGATAFLADEIESVAHLLKREPVEFFAEYLASGTGDFKPTESNPRPKDYKAAVSDLDEFRSRRGMERAEARHA